MRHNTHDIELAILLKILQDNEIKSVTVEYSGGGDSGGVDNNNLPLDIANKEYLFPSRHLGTTLMTLENIVTNVLGEMMPGGFENNEGGRGTVTLFDSGLLEHEHIDYLEEYASNDYDSEAFLAAEGGDVALGYMRRGLDAYIRNLPDPSEIGNITSVSLGLRAMSDDDEDSNIEDVSLSISRNISPSYAYLREETTETEEIAFRQIVERFTSNDVGECCQLSFELTAVIKNGQIDTSSLTLEAGYYEKSEKQEASEKEVSPEAEANLGALTVYVRDDKSGFYLDKDQASLQTIEIDGVVCIGALGEPFKTSIDASSKYYALPTEESKSWQLSAIDLASTNEIVRIGLGLDGLHCETLERTSSRRTYGQDLFVCKNKQVISFSSLCSPDETHRIRAKVISYIESKLHSNDSYNFNAYQGNLQKFAMDHVKWFAENAPLDDVNHARQISKNCELKSILESGVLLRQSQAASSETNEANEAMELVATQKRRARF